MDQSNTFPVDLYQRQPAGMTNRYRILGETTIILIERRNGDALQMMIDTSDLPRVLALPGPIHASPSSTHPDLIYAKCRPDGRKRSAEEHPA